MTALPSQPHGMPTTKQWCADREHPFVTYNPWLDRSYCRCGQRQHPGKQPIDWKAKRDLFHSCPPGGPCRCYVDAGKPIGS